MKEFTEFDKELARNIYGRYEWIARDAVGDLHLFVSKPSKEPRMWDCQHDNVNTVRLPVYNAFESIRWNDDEPTLIRSIYDPQILTNTEREYLKAVLKPFRNRTIRVVKVNDGEDKEFIYVAINEDAMLYRFPSFKRYEKYVGMENGHEYSLRELGITHD